jgi:hypothetical protein
MEVLESRLASTSEKSFGKYAWVGGLSDRAKARETVEKQAKELETRWQQLCLEVAGVGANPTYQDRQIPYRVAFHSIERSDQREAVPGFIDWAGDSGFGDELYLRQLVQLAELGECLLSAEVDRQLASLLKDSKLTTQMYPFSEAKENLVPGMVNLKDRSYAPPEDLRGLLDSIGTLQTVYQYVPDKTGTRGGFLKKCHSWMDFVAGSAGKPLILDIRYELDQEDDNRKGPQNEYDKAVWAGALGPVSNENHELVFRIRQPPVAPEKGQLHFVTAPQEVTYRIYCPRYEQFDAQDVVIAGNNPLSILYFLKACDTGKGVPSKAGVTVYRVEPFWHINAINQDVELVFDVELSDGDGEHVTIPDAIGWFNPTGSNDTSVAEGAK